MVSMLLSVFGGKPVVSLLVCITFLSAFIGLSVYFDM